MKTHVSKISLGLWSSIYPLGKMKSHLYFQRGEMQNIKMIFSSYNLMVASYPYLSLDSKLVEKKMSYCNSKIRSIVKFRFKCRNWVELQISKWVFSHEFLLSYRSHNIFRIRIWMSRTHFVIFSPLTIR